jgi:uncharacterized membrane protein YphA (DoxX/SURF4 family)
MLRTLASWLIALPLAAFLFWSAWEKLMDAESARAVFETLAQRTGIGLFEPTFRFFMGIIEGLGACLMVFPASRRFAACILMAVLGGAAAMHFTPFLGQEVPITLDWDAGYDGKARLFATLLALAGAILVLLIHPKWSPQGQSGRVA